MELRQQKQIYLFFILESWLTTEVRYTDSSKEYIPKLKKRYFENFKNITDMTYDSDISYEQFTSNIQTILS
jgi:hypothetical protein